MSLSKKTPFDQSAATIEVVKMDSQTEKQDDGPKAIATALDGSGGAPNPWGKGHVQLYVLCILIYFCSTMNGTSGFQSFR
jgi:hypothetical protein